jgi:hypothetical protein
MIMRWYRRPRSRDNDDTWLDTFLDAADEEILDALNRLDLDAGLAAIIGQPSTEASTSGPSTRAAEICRVLARLISAITPRLCYPGQVRASTFYLETAAALLAELRNGLTGRVIDRDDALRLLRLAQHNLIEAVPLLMGETSRRRSASKSEPKRELDLARHAAEQINDLFPQVSTLFDDTGEHAPAPVPQVPR